MPAAILAGDDREALVSRTPLGPGEVRFAMEEIQGWPGITPMLTVGCELQALGYYPGAAAVLLAELHAWFSNSNVALGTTHPVPVVLGYPRGQRYVGQPDLPAPLRMQLRLAIDASSYLRLEEVREGREFRLQARVTALLTSGGSPEPGQPPPPGRRELATVHPQAEWQDDIQVSQDQWHRVLRSWGVGVAVPLGVAIPTVMPGAAHAKVVAQLREANERLNGGDMKGSLGATRQAVELLRDLTGATRPLPGAAKDRTVAQRHYALAQALFDLTSAAVHPDPLVGQEQWGRHDALLALASAAALAQRLFSIVGATT
jgi:hypothetical protein